MAWLSLSIIEVIKELLWFCVTTNLSSLGVNSEELSKLSRGDFDDDLSRHFDFRKILKHESTIFMSLTAERHPRKEKV
jgi:hypothetical protein